MIPGYPSLHRLMLAAGLVWVMTSVSYFGVTYHRMATQLYPTDPRRGELFVLRCGSTLPAERKITLKPALVFINPRRNDGE